MRILKPVSALSFICFNFFVYTNTHLIRLTNAKMRCPVVSSIFLRRLFASAFFLLLTHQNLLSEEIPEYTNKKLVTPPIEITINGPEELVFPFESQNCKGNDEWGNRLDLPDAPLRAYRKKSGDLVILASHYNNIFYQTTDLSRIFRSNCDSVYPSEKNDDPASFSDRSWLISTAVLDSGNIYGLVHNEYWGSLHNTWCRIRLGHRAFWDSVCLYVNLTGALSQNQGSSFKRISGDLGVAAAYPYPFNIDMNRAGIRDPSNIFRNPRNNAYYFVAWADAWQHQRRGACLFRSVDPEKEPWLAWDGTGFRARLSSPFDKSGQKDATVCQPVSELYFSTIVYSSLNDIFIALGAEERIKPGGVFYRTSKDLFNWSAPKFLVEGHSFGFWKPGEKMMVYPSLVDPKSTSPNFDQVGQFPYLYFHSARIDSSGALKGRERDIVRIPLAIKANNY